MQDKRLSDRIMKVFIDIRFGKC